MTYLLRPVSSSVTPAELESCLATNVVLSAFVEIMTFFQGSLDSIPLDLDTICPEHLVSAIPFRLRDSRETVEVGDIGRGTDGQASPYGLVETSMEYSDHSWYAFDQYGVILSDAGSMEQSDQ